MPRRPSRWGFYGTENEHNISNDDDDAWPCDPAPCTDVEVEDAISLSWYTDEYSGRHAGVQYDARAEGALQSKSLVAAHERCKYGRQRHKVAVISGPIAVGMPRQGPLLRGCPVLCRAL